MAVKIPEIEISVDWRSLASIWWFFVLMILLAAALFKVPFTDTLFKVFLGGVLYHLYSKRKI